MTRLLVVTASPHKAGAEKVIEQLIQSLPPGITCQVAVTGRWRETPTGFYPHQAKGLLSCLFSQTDVIHSHLFWAGLLVRVRRTWDRSFKWVHTVHYVDYRSQRWPRLRKWLDRHWIFAATDTLVAVSPVVLKSLPQLPQALLIQNSLSLQTKSRTAASLTGALPKPTQTQHGVTQIGTLTMLRLEKGVIDIVHTAKALKHSGRQFVWYIGGSGPLEGHLRRLIYTEGLQDQVQLLGYIQNTDEFYSRLHIYVQPSHSESFGIAAAEAFQYHLPIVATDAGNLPNLLGQGRFGKIVSRSTRKSATDRPPMVDAICQVIDHQPDWELRSQAGLNFWQSQLSPNQMNEAYYQLYSIDSSDCTPTNLTLIEGPKESTQQRGVLVASPIVTQGGGGLPRQILLQTQMLAKLGYKIYLLQRNDPTLRSNLKKQELWSHVEVIEVGFLSTKWIGRRILERLNGLIFIVAGLTKIFFIRKDFQIFHAHQLYSPTQLGAVVKWLFEKRLVVRVTASGELGEARALKNLPFSRLRRWAFGLVDQVIVLSDQMNSEMRNLGFSQTQICKIPNTVEIPLTHTEANREARRLRILYTGRLSQEKSLNTLVMAVQKIGRKGTPVTLHLVGAPEPRRDATPELQRLLADTPANTKIQLVSHTDQISNYYDTHDIFVLPSRSEGMSNALLEAMAHGMACIASDIPPNRELIAHEKTGLLFRCEDVEDLVCQIESLVPDIDRADSRANILGNNAQAYIQKNHSPSAVGLRLVRLYGTLLGEGAPT